MSEENPTRMYKYLEINAVIEIMLNRGIEARQGWSGTLVAPNGACPGHSNKYFAAWRGAYWGPLGVRLKGAPALKKILFNFYTKFV